jgi:glycine/D-amino acid oxidase-like deaminating enzyme
MTGTADVVVIGGGVNGMCIAYALTVAGVRRVTLVEKGALASGASGRSSALVRMHYTNEWDARLARASFPTFQNWPEIMGGPTVFTQTGMLALVGPQDADHLRKNVAMLRGVGVNTVALSPAELLDLQPFLDVSDVGAAAYEPESGYASPADTVEGFRRRACEMGARVLQWTEVTAIRHQGGGRVTGVETSAGPIEAPVVVVTAGAWSGRLCRSLGLELPARVKAIDTVVVTRPPALARPPMTVMDNVQSTYFRPESGVLTIVGVPCVDWDPDPDHMALGSSGLPPAAPAQAAEILTHRIPAMEGATLARGYRAFDYYSADRHAILDRVDGLDGLYLATASSGTGFKTAPAVGTCMAELILHGEARTVDIRPFGLRRFREGRPLEGPFPYTPRKDLVEPENR